MRTSCPARVQVLGEGPGDVGEPAGLRQRRDLGGEQADGGGCGHGRGEFLAAVRGYDVVMRRLLIGLTVTLLVVVSIGVGVAVARWPQHAHLWP